MAAKRKSKQQPSPRAPKSQRATSPIPEPEPRKPEPGNSDTDSEEYESPLAYTLNNELSAVQFRSAFLPPSDPLLYPSLRDLDTPTTLRVARTDELTDAEIRALYDIVYETSGQDYKASSRGWSESEKIEEMRQKGTWYVMVYFGDEALAIRKPNNGAHLPGVAFRDGATYKYSDGDNKKIQGNAAESKIPVPCAFISFHPTTDYPPAFNTVLYIYEIHIANNAEFIRNRGLGTHLLNLAETVAKRASIDKMMLTVFTSNQGARRFYSNQGYERDVASPKNRVTRNRVIEPEYYILSKVIGDMEGEDLDNDDTASDEEEDEEPNPQPEPHPAYKAAYAAAHASALAAQSPAHRAAIDDREDWISEDSDTDTSSSSSNPSILPRHLSTGVHDIPATKAMGADFKSMMKDILAKEKVEKEEADIEAKQSAINNSMLTTNDIPAIVRDAREFQEAVRLSMQQSAQATVGSSAGHESVQATVGSGEETTPKKKDYRRRHQWQRKKRGGAGASGDV